MTEKTLRPGCLWVAGLLAAVVALGVAGRFLLQEIPVPFSPPEEKQGEINNLGATKVARPKAISQTGFVGGNACQACHAEICESYSGHPMANSAAFMPIPSDIEDHSGPRTEFSIPNGIRYRVEIKGPQIMHHEIATGDDGLVRYDQAVPMSLVIGAGVRAKSYAANFDGILLESPISWYAADGGYFELSPGYDKFNSHFNRRWYEGCVVCHLGRTEIDEQGKFIFKELNVGCERCHGPGENHVQLQTSKSTPSPDTSIVNPARLPPRERESICNDCHLPGAFRTTRYGRRASDFRPGMALEEVSCVLVKPMAHSGAALIVSQVEQMRSSRCFLQSQGRMGCTSCHDPHRQSDPGAKANDYRLRCLKCHASSGCSLPAAKREAVQDSCIECHMPASKSSTVSHISQTDHRIPRNPRLPSEDESSSPADQGLQFFDRAFERLPEWEVKRVWGLKTAKDPKATPEEAQKAIENLVPLVQLASDDAGVLQAIGILHIRLGDYQEARGWLEKAMALDPSNDYVVSNLAAACLRTKDHLAALQHADRCLELNPHTANHFVLKAAALAALGKREEAAAAAKQALEFDRSLTGRFSIERLPGVMPNK